MEILNRVVELEKTDIKHDADLKKLEDNQTRICHELTDIRTDMNQGFRRITGSVIAAGGSIILLLLTALAVLIYDRLQ